MTESERDADHVLISPKALSNGEHTYHLPKDDDAETPRCETTLRDGRDWDREALASVRIEHWSLCKRCDPDHDIDHTSPGEGHTLASRIEDLDPDDIGQLGGLGADAEPRGGGA
jgi:hypothetical protein